MGFAYSQSMQLILLAVSTVVTVIINFITLNLALMLNGTTVNNKRKALFIIIFSAGQQALIYVLYLSGILHNLFPGPAEAMIRVPSPLMAILFYVLLVRVTKLSKYRCLYVENEIYIYGVAVNMLARIIGDAFFPQTGAAYNYLTDLHRVLAGFILALAFFFVFRHLLQKYKYVMHLNDNLMLPHFKRKLAISILFYFLIYLTATVVPYRTPGLTDDLFCMLLLFVATALYISILMNRVNSTEQKNKDVYIHSLIQVNNEFRELKHDFSNILQGYGGYLDLGKLDKLKKYHDSVTKEMRISGVRLTLGARLEEDPLLISLLIDKETYAEKLGVDFRVSINGKLEREYFTDLDIIRFSSILLDNAIEAAAESAEKKVSLTYYVKQNGNRLYVISNSTKGHVNLDQMLEPGVTTKEGHMGMGLPTARRLVGKYQNCSLNCTSYGNEVTIYVESAKIAGESTNRAEAEPVHA